MHSIDTIERLEAATELVYAFWPRQIDYPHHVADDAAGVEGLEGGFLGAEQCDGCGCATYRVERRKNGFVAKCAVDPDDDVQHADPCGTEYQIRLFNADDVVF